MRLDCHPKYLEALSAQNVVFPIAVVVLMGSTGPACITGFAIAHCEEVTLMAQRMASEWASGDDARCLRAVGRFSTLLA